MAPPSQALTPPDFFLSDPTIAPAVRACEQACRRLAHACMSVAQMATAPGFEACMNAVMDCSYAAAATARILSRADRHGLPVILPMVDVCARLALIGADSCEQQRSSPPLLLCGEASRECSLACAALLGALEAQSPAVVGSPRRSSVRAG